MRTFTTDEMRDIIKEHEKWRRCEGGNRADLSNADLREHAGLIRVANLSGSNLSRSDLSWSDLSGSNLSRSKGIPPERITPLLILRDQPGKIRAYKLVNADYQSPIRSTGKLTYTPGETLEVKDADTDPLKQCAAGISLCTLDWCLREWREGYHVMLCEFTAKDIACIPTATDGKFRVTKAKVLREYDITPIFEREQKEREEWEKENA